MNSNSPKIFVLDRYDLRDIIKYNNHNTYKIYNMHLTSPGMITGDHGIICILHDSKRFYRSYEIGRYESTPPGVHWQNIEYNNIEVDKIKFYSIPIEFVEIIEGDPIYNHFRALIEKMQNGESK